MHLFGKTIRFLVSLLAVSGLVANGAFAEICFMDCGEAKPVQEASCCESQAAPETKPATHCGAPQQRNSQAPVLSREGSAGMCSCDHELPAALIAVTASAPEDDAPVTFATLPARAFPVSAARSISSPALRSGLHTGPPRAFMEHCAYLC